MSKTVNVCQKDFPGKTRNFPMRLVRRKKLIKKVEDMLHWSSLEIVNVLKRIDPQETAVYHKVIKVTVPPKKNCDGTVGYLDSFLKNTVVKDKFFLVAFNFSNGLECIREGHVLICRYTDFQGEVTATVWDPNYLTQGQLALRASMMNVSPLGFAKIFKKILFHSRIKTAQLHLFSGVYRNDIGSCLYTALEELKRAAKNQFVMRYSRSIQFKFKK